MPQQRCAICDGGNDLRTLCDTHYWLTVYRREVLRGAISDWPCNTGGAVNHAEMQTLRAYGARYSWQVDVNAINRMARSWLDGWQQGESVA